MKSVVKLTILACGLMTSILTAHAEGSAEIDFWSSKGNIYAVPRPLPDFDANTHKIGTFSELVAIKQLDANTKLQSRKSIGKGLNGEILFESAAVCLVKTGAASGVAGYYVICAKSEEEVLKLSRGIALCPKGLCMSVAIRKDHVAYSEWTFVGSFEHTVGRTFIFPTDPQKPAMVFSSQGYKLSNSTQNQP